MQSILIFFHIFDLDILKHDASKYAYLIIIIGKVLPLFEEAIVQKKNTKYFFTCFTNPLYCGFKIVYPKARILFFILIIHVSTP